MKKITTIFMALLLVMSIFGQATNAHAAETVNVKQLGFKFEDGTAISKMNVAIYTSIEDDDSILDGSTDENGVFSDEEGHTQVNLVANDYYVLVYTDDLEQVYDFQMKIETTDAGAELEFTVEGDHPTEAGNVTVKNFGFKFSDGSAIANASYVSISNEETFDEFEGTTDKNGVFSDFDGETAINLATGEYYVYIETADGKSGFNFLIEVTAEDQNSECVYNVKNIKNQFSMGTLADISAQVKWTSTAQMSEAELYTVTGSGDEKEYNFVKSINVAANAKNTTITGLKANTSYMLSLYSEADDMEYYYYYESKTKAPIDRKAPAKPTAISKVTAKSTSITGKAEAGSTVYVYRGTAKVGSAVATSKGTFSIKIAKQKQGTKLSIYAVDKAKNKGASVVVTVQK